MSVRFYFDHNMQQAVVVGLRERGVDVLTLRDDGHDRHSDEAVLHRAATLGRVIVTRDQDFLELAARYLSTSTSFPGILFCHPTKSSIGILVSDLELIQQVSTYDELMNTVVWLPL